MIRALAADIFKERFADFPEDPILVRFKRRLTALGCVKHNASRFGTVNRYASFQGEDQIGTWTVGEQRAGIDTKAVTVNLRAVVFLNEPNSAGGWASSGLMQ